MNFLHHQFDLEPGDVVEVIFDNPANVQLLDQANYTAYKDGKPYRYVGGYATESPLRLEVPRAGRWHVTVDLGGNVGRVRASVAILAPAKA